MSKTGTMPVVRLSGIKADALMGAWGACEDEQDFERHGLKWGVTWIEGTPDAIMGGLDLARHRMEWIDGDEIWKEWEYLGSAEQFAPHIWRRIVKAHNKRMTEAKKALWLAVEQIFHDVYHRRIEDFEGRHKVLFREVWPYCESDEGIL